MNIHKLAIAILFGSMALVGTTQTTQAKGFSSSGGRSSVSTSSVRSYSRPISTNRTTTRPAIVKPAPTVSASKPYKSKSRGEYEYFALNDCKRIVKPINGYRCFDRD